MFFCLLSCLITFSSCFRDRSVQVVPNEELQNVIDSLVMLNNSEKEAYDLFVDQVSSELCFMVLYMGDESFYKRWSKVLVLPHTDDVLSVYHFVSKGHKVRIYSGIEFYFNLQGKGKDVCHARLLLKENEQRHSLWVIPIYKNEIREVYPVMYQIRG